MIIVVGAIATMVLEVRTSEAQVEAGREVALDYLDGAVDLEAQALARRGEAYRIEGYFRDASRDLQVALDKAAQSNGQALIAAASGALGNLALMSRRAAAAEPLLKRSRDLAGRLRDPAILTASNNDLGNLYTSTGRPAGVIAESSPSCTLSSIEEGRARVSQGPEAVFDRRRRPDVIAVEGDVLPAERGDVGKDRVRDGLAIKEHYADTGGVTEHVFGLCYLLGFRFAPRIRDLADRRLYVTDGRADHGALKPLIGGAVNFRIVEENWDEILRLAASIRARTVAPSAAMRRLAAYPRQNALAKALREIGCIERTLFTLDWITDPALRRRSNAGLNKGEARNALARTLFFHRHGEIRDRTFENQSYRASGLNLAVAAVILWNTI
jgi:hypothetical protein